MAERFLSYHSIFDPGHAAIQFPLKNQGIDRDLSHEFDEELRKVLHFHLLWRPSLIVRHIDLFNNIPLMRFMRSNEARLLCSRKMLRVIVPHDGDFKEMFKSWAFDKQGQHFHHLNKDEQAVYDHSCRQQKLSSLEHAQKHILFSRYGIDLAETLGAYQFHLTGLRETLRWNPPAGEYPQKVLHEWERILRGFLDTAPYNKSDIDLIDSVIRHGVQEGWRRRQFFTKIESLESDIPSGRLDARNRLLRDVKLVALNSPFYDELESLRYSEKDIAPVCVTRDLTLISKVRPADPGSVGLEQNDALQRDLLAFNKIPLRNIIRWHSDENPNPEFKAFQKSVAQIEELMNGGYTTAVAHDVYGMINNHVDVLNACIRRTSIDEKVTIENETAVLQAFAPHHSQAINTATGSILSLLAGIVAAHQGWTGEPNTWGSWIIGSLTSAAVSITLASPSCRIKTTEWDRAEAVLKRQIESQVKSHVELIPGPMDFR